MNNSNVAVVIVGGLGLGLAGLGLMVAMKARAEPPEEEPPELYLEIVPISAIAAPGNPTDVYEYESYFVRATITNTSTKAGEPSAATLKHRLTVIINDLLVADSGVVSVDYLAGESKVAELEFTVPGESADVVGADFALGELFSLDDVLLASSSLVLNVLKVPISVSIISLEARPQGETTFTLITEAQTFDWWDEIIDISVRSRNDPSSAPIYMRTIFELIDPDGISLGKSTYIDDILKQPGADSYAWFGAPGGWFLNKEGIYTAIAHSLAARAIDDIYEVVKTREWQFTVVAEVIPGGEIILT